MAVRDTSKLQMAVPEIPTDQIIGITSGTVSVAATAPGGVTGNDAQDSGVGAAALPTGIISFDDGATWIDLGDSYYDGTEDPSFGLRYCGTNAICYNDGRVQVNLQNFTDNPLTAQYKTALLVRPDSGILVPQPIEQPFNYTTKYNYMKIKTEGAYRLAVGEIKSFDHNLGYYPNFSVWAKIDFLLTPEQEFISVSGGEFATIDNDKLYLDGTNIGFDITIYYRVYYDG